MEKVIENNVAVLSGTIVSEFIFDNEVYGRNIYMSYLRSKRFSDSVDTIPIRVPESLIDVYELWSGKNVRVCGQFRSYNKRDEYGSHLKLSLFVRSLEVVEEEECNENEIYLDGYYCKDPVYRTTPLGKRITDAMIAVNRPYGKCDYIPCILWEENAVFGNKLPMGTHCRIKGRMQSRLYDKKISETEVEKRIAYEVSALEIWRCENG